MPTRHSSLYRQESLQGIQAHAFGDAVEIGQTRALSTLMGMTAVMAVGAVLVGIFGGYERKLTLAGTLVPLGGIVDIYSTESATVNEILVKEGDIVQAGQPVAQLQAERLLASGQLSQLQNQAIKKRQQSASDDLEALAYQIRQRATTLRQQYDSLSNEITEYSADLANGHDRLKLAETSVQRFRGLAQAGFVSQTQAQQREEELLDLQLRQRTLERQLEAARRSRDTVQAEIAANEAALRSGTARHRGEQANLEQEARDVEARTLWSAQAPQTGRVATINVTRGQFATAGAAIMTLLPVAEEDAALVAHLYADSRSIGLINRDHRVYIRYAAFPYQKFGLQQATILDVGTTPISPKDIPAGQADAIFSAAPTKEPLYRIRVKLPTQFISDGRKNYALKSGMQISASVRMERRALWEWLFEPILSLNS